MRAHRTSPNSQAQSLNSFLWLKFPKFSKHKTKIDFSNKKIFLHVIQTILNIEGQRSVGLGDYLHLFSISHSLGTELNIANVGETTLNHHFTLRSPQNGINDRELDLGGDENLRFISMSHPGWVRWVSWGKLCDRSTQCFVTRHDRWTSWLKRYREWWLRGCDAFQRCQFHQVLRTRWEWWSWRG